MEFITLSNGVKMPALGYGTFTMSNENRALRFGSN